MNGKIPLMPRDGDTTKMINDYILLCIFRLHTNLIFSRPDVVFVIGRHLSSIETYIQDKCCKAFIQLTLEIRRRFKSSVSGKER